MIPVGVEQLGLLKSARVGVGHARQRGAALALCREEIDDLVDLGCRKECATTARMPLLTASLLA